MANRKRFACFSLLLLAMAASVIFFIFQSSSNAAGNQKEENYRWDEAARFVDNLPFHKQFIDSLKKAHNITFPLKPLREGPGADFFRPETLVYDIGWGPFKAGYVVLTASRDSGTNTIKLGGKGLSNGFVSSFYRMRDYIISTIDATGLYPLFFEQHIREGKKYRRDGWILFDHANNRIHVKERRVKTLKAPPFVNDFLSVLYLARSRKLVPRDTFALPLYGDGKIHSLAIYCKDRQTLQIGGTRIPTLLVQPRLVGDKGAFNKKDRLEIWFSDDEKKIPIQIKSKISIGSITARLLYSNQPGFIIPAAEKVSDSGKTGDSTADSSLLMSDSLKTAPPPAPEDTSMGTAEVKGLNSIKIPACNPSP